MTCRSYDCRACTKTQNKEPLGLLAFASDFRVGLVDGSAMSRDDDRAAGMLTSTGAEYRAFTSIAFKQQRLAGTIIAGGPSCTTWLGEIRWQFTYFYWLNFPTLLLAEF